MGMFDVVLIPCPKCNTIFKAQSKGGERLLCTYTLSHAPFGVMSDINGHAPFECANCKTRFYVELMLSYRVTIYQDTIKEEVGAYKNGYEEVDAYRNGYNACLKDFDIKNEFGEKSL